MLEIRVQLYILAAASVPGKQNFSPNLERLWEGKGVVAQAVC